MRRDESGSGHASTPLLMRRACRSEGPASGSWSISPFCRYVIATAIFESRECWSLIFDTVPTPGAKESVPGFEESHAEPERPNQRPGAPGHMGRLDGKVALVTGAARGTGAAIAQMFADEGARIVIADLLDDRGNETAEKIGDAARFRHHDVTSERRLGRSGRRAARHRKGQLDVLVNDAAVLHLSSIDDTSAETFETVFRVNCFGPFLGTKACLPLLRERRGAIVNIGSINSLFSHSGHGCVHSGEVRLARAHQGDRAGERQVRRARQHRLPRRRQPRDARLARRQAAGRAHRRGAGVGRRGDPRDPPSRHRPGSTSRASRRSRCSSPPRKPATATAPSSCATTGCRPVR